MDANTLRSKHHRDSSARGQRAGNDDATRSAGMAHNQAESAFLLNELEG